MSDSIRDLLESGLREEVYPGAVLLVAQGKEIVSYLNVGNRASIPKHLPMEKDTIFDLASLTKPLGTALACLKLVDQGLLDLDTSISDFIEPFPWKDKADLTARLLLNHSAGLADWKPFYRELTRYPMEERKPLLRRLIMEEHLLGAPKSVSLYSDLGFMLLEWIVELIAGQDLSSFLMRRFTAPLGWRRSILTILLPTPDTKRSYLPQQNTVHGEGKLCKAMSTMKTHMPSEVTQGIPGSSEQHWMSLPWPQPWLTYIEAPPPSCSPLKP